MSDLARADDILCEFLRTNLTDTRSRYTSDSDTFDATASQTVFTLTPTDSSHLVRAIKSVTKNAVTLNKWQDYSIDLLGKTITLSTGATLHDAVIVNYYASGSGGEWIYPGYAVDSLGASKFPRIFVSIINSTADNIGAYDSGVINSIHFQIDVWTKKDYEATISSKLYTEQDLADYFGYKLAGFLKSNVNEMYPKLYDYRGVAFRQLPYEEESQTFRHSQEILLSGVNVGL